MHSQGMKSIMENCREQKERIRVGPQQSYLEPFSLRINTSIIRVFFLLVAGEVEGKVGWGSEFIMNNKSVFFRSKCINRISNSD